MENPTTFLALDKFVFIAGNFLSVSTPIFHLHYRKAPTTSSHPRMHSTAGFLFCFSLKLWEPFSASAKKKVPNSTQKITLFSFVPCLFVDRTGKEALGSLCCLTWQCVLFLWQASKYCVWVKNCSLRLHIMDNFSFSRNSTDKNARSQICLAECDENTQNRARVVGGKENRKCYIFPKEFSLYRRRTQSSRMCQNYRRFHSSTSVGHEKELNSNFTL